MLHFYFQEKMQWPRVNQTDTLRPKFTNRFGDDSKMSQPHYARIKNGSYFEQNYLLSSTVML